MNVLLLTPDRVGSTLLQRLLTIYMLRREFDQPVINLHELTNGLVKYFHTELNQQVLGKPDGVNQKWGYFQSLPEIADLLSSVDHYKTSRMAHYHLMQRQDSIKDQLEFYEYLNNNFYIISCRRENLFEHALSWVINSHSKKLNVYSADEKISTFSDIYKQGITVSKEALHTHLNNYKNYIEWSDRYFNIQSYFNYDTDVRNIENYILNLDFMRGHSKNTWEDMFGQSFANFNTCHKLLPDLQLINSADNDTVKVAFHSPKQILQWDSLKGADWPSLSEINCSTETLPTVIAQEINEFKRTLKLNLDPITGRVNTNVAQFLNENLTKYVSAYNSLDQLVKQGFLVTGVPIKLQSLKEKQLLIKNYTEAIEWYNEWAIRNSYGPIYDINLLENIIVDEEEFLASPFTKLLT